AGALDPDLRRRIVDARDRLADVGAVVAATDRCGADGAATTPTTAGPSTTTAADAPTTAPADDPTAGLPAVIATCVRETFAGAPPPALDPATDPAVRVCALAELAAFLRAGAAIDEPTAQCGAAAVVDRLGLPLVLDLLAGAPPSDEVAAGVQAALATC
ncbi:MAG: hypothetical protein H0W25_01370, partial [Acidimicrobiia bacterium]|nr:hypothetical protein [Acidimicrobiia bacterium]